MRFGAYTALIGFCLVAVTFGCGGKTNEGAGDSTLNACQSAERRLTACFPEQANESTGACEGVAECVAGCVNRASCAELEAAFSGQQNAFSSCVAGC